MAMNSKDGLRGRRLQFGEVLDYRRVGDLLDDPAPKSGVGTRKIRLFAAAACAKFG